MTRLTDSELDALALRLWNAWTDDNGAFEGFAEVAREAAQWASERDRERFEPLRRALDDRERKSAAFHASQGLGATLQNLTTFNQAERDVLVSARALVGQADQVPRAESGSPQAVSSR